MTFPAFRCPALPDQALPAAPAARSPAVSTRRIWRDVGARTATNLALGAALLASTACSLAGDAPDRRVTLEAARTALSERSAVVIDIREPDEHARGVAAGARLLPMSQLGRRLGELPRDPAQPLLLICNTQNRSSRVADALRSQGYTDVRYVQGGMSGWAARGWPMVPLARP